MSTPTVYILATVRNPALLDAALLVFKTLRTGFPTAHVFVCGNGLEVFAAQEVKHAADRIGAAFNNHPRLFHDRFIEDLLLAGSGPFWVCDTDMVFFGKVEDWFDQEKAEPMAGRFEPEFLEEWTKSCHVERLHTCLMWLNAPVIRQGMRSWMGGFPGMFAQAQMNLVREQFIPVRGQEPLFYDTCAGLYHALGGREFTAEQNDAFEHLHCGTYSDQIKVPGLKDLAEVHKAVFANPSLARGLFLRQSKYYQSRKRGATLVVTEKGAHALQPTDHKPGRRNPQPRDRAR